MAKTIPFCGVHFICLLVLIVFFTPGAAFGELQFADVACPPHMPYNQEWGLCEVWINSFLGITIVVVGIITSVIVNVTIFFIVRLWNKRKNREK